MPPAASDGRASGWANPKRLIEALRAASVRPTALAVLFDAPALAALVDHLLAATEAAAPDADTATLRTAIGRHRAAARDQRAFLAGVAVAFQGVGLDLEALAAAANGAPHDDDTDTDALGPRVAQHDGPGAAGVTPDAQASVISLKEGAAEPRALLIDAVERSRAQPPAQFAAAGANGVAPHTRLHDA